MSSSPAVETPTREGPPLLAAHGAADHESGIQMVMKTMQKFGREVEQAMSSVSQRSVATAISSTSSHRQPETVLRTLNTLVDISPKSVPAKAIIETLVLSSLVLTAFSLASLLGGYLLAPFVTLVVPPVGAAILSGVVAPLVVYYQVTRGYTALTGLRLLVLAAVAQSVLVGAALSHLSVSAEPFVALSAIASSFAIAVTGQTSRTSLLAITISTSLLIHSSIGALEGALTPVYFALTGLYTLAAIIPIQLAARDQRRANINVYTALLVGLTITAKCLIYGAIGASSGTVEMEAEHVEMMHHEKIAVEH